MLETVFGRWQICAVEGADGAHLDAGRAPHELDERAADRFGCFLSAEAVA